VAFAAFNRMPVPVIVGVGRSMQRGQANLEHAMDPIQLAQVAAEQALADARVPSSAVDAVMFVAMLGEFRLPRKMIPAYDNPGLSLARALGLKEETRCMLTELGGNSPQFCVNEAAERISRGELSCCLVSGAEAIDSLMKGLKQKYKISQTAATSTENKVLRWGDKTGIKPEMIGSKESVTTIQDLLHDTTEMPVCYAMLDEAERIHAGETPSEREQSNAKMFHGFSKVAAYKENAKHSWFPVERSVEEIACQTDFNRMVATPYKKLCCSIMDVNQGASVLVMSDERAEELGIPRENWVYLHGAADCNDVGVRVTKRPELHRCVGMKIIGEQLSINANKSLGEMDFYDVYSCFPIAVRMAVNEMNLPKQLLEQPERLTVTGGLPFHGGPGNNYVLHSIAAMVEKLRRNQGKFGLVTANGGVVSKHSAGVYSTTPYSETHPDHPNEWRRGDCKAQLEQAKAAYPERDIARGPNACEGVVTNYSVRCKAGSKPFAVIALGDITSGPEKGKRFLAKATDKSLTQAFNESTEKFLGQKVTLSSIDVTGKGKLFQTSFALATASL